MLAGIEAIKRLGSIMCTVERTLMWLVYFVFQPTYLVTCPYYEVEMLHEVRGACGKVFMVAIG